MASPLPGNGSRRRDSSSTMRRQVSVVTVVMVLGVAFVLLAAVITLLGDPEAGEPKVTLKVQPQARGVNEVVSATPQTPGGPSSSSALIAANGTVISDPALTE